MFVSESRRTENSYINALSYSIYVSFWQGSFAVNMYDLLQAHSEYFKIYDKEDHVGCWRLDMDIFCIETYRRLSYLCNAFHIEYRALIPCCLYGLPSTKTSNAPKRHHSERMLLVWLRAFKKAYIIMYGFYFLSWKYSCRGYIVYLLTYFLHVLIYNILWKASSHPVMWLSGLWAYKNLLVNTIGFFFSALGNLDTGRRFCLIYSNSEYGNKRLEYLPYICGRSRALEQIYALRLLKSLLETFVIDLIFVPRWLSLQYIRLEIFFQMLYAYQIHGSLSQVLNQCWDVPGSSSFRSMFGGSSSYKTTSTLLLWLLGLIPTIMTTIIRGFSAQIMLSPDFRRCCSTSHALLASLEWQYSIKCGSQVCLSYEQNFQSIKSCRMDSE